MKNPKKYYEFLKKHNPYVYNSFVNSHKQVVMLVEHPVKGDEVNVIAMFPEKGLAFDTDFFDTEDMLAAHKEYEPKLDDDGSFFIGNDRKSYPLPPAQKLSENEEKFLDYVSNRLIPDMKEQKSTCSDINEMLRIIDKLRN